jgi:hypothetical protein
VTGVQIAVAPSDSLVDSDSVQSPCRLKLLKALFKLIDSMATLTGVMLRFLRPTIALNGLYSLLAGLF